MGTIIAEPRQNFTVWRGGGAKVEVKRRVEAVMQMRNAMTIVLSASGILCVPVLRLEPNKVVFARAQCLLGLESYTPTRIEWLHLEAVALLAGSSSLPKYGYATGMA